MNRDLAMSKFDARFAYENKNLRLMTDKETSKFVMTNERGPERITVWFYDKRTGQWHVNDWNHWLLGLVLGCAALGNHLVLFTHGNFKAYNATTGDFEDVVRDRIYRLDFEDDATDGMPVKCYLLYTGNLGFDMEHPIETLPFYEAEEIQKVYWTDGVNQPRMINIMADTDGYNDKSFDYAQEVSGAEKVSVTRYDNTNGMFPSGVVQYAFTYVRHYGQESSVAGVSPLMYIADDDRGAAPDEVVACSFEVQLQGLSDRFDGIRLYSIIRSSKNGTPIVKRIAELAIKDGSVHYTDTNTTGADVENTYLLYVGAKEVTIETMTQKDNTAFYGNIEEKHKYLGEGLRDKIRLGSKTGGAFTSLLFRNNKVIPLAKTYSKYEWESQLKESAEKIRFFQYGEVYRFGLQFQDKFGNWSEVVRIESNDAAVGHDFKQNLQPESLTRNYMSSGIDMDVMASSRNDLWRKCATFLGFLDMTRLDGLLDDYIAVRPVVVYPEWSDRSVLAQGILTPTVYNMEDRVNNGTFAQMSWFSRPLVSNEALSPSVETVGSLLDSTNNYTNLKTLEVRHCYPLPPTNRYSQLKEVAHPYEIAFGGNAELVCNFESKRFDNSSDSYYKNIDYTIWANIYPWQEADLYNGDDPYFDKHQRATQLRSEFFVDQSIETFHSPEVEYTDHFANMDMEGVKMRIVGLVPLSYCNEGVHVYADTITADNYLHEQERYIKNGGTSNSGSNGNAAHQVMEFGGIQADFESETIERQGVADNDYTAKVRYYGTNKLYPWHTKTLTYTPAAEDQTDIIADGDTYRDFGYMQCSSKNIYIGSPKSTLLKKIYETLKYSYESIYLSDYRPVSIDKPSYHNTVDNGIVFLDVDGTRQHFNFNVNKVVVPNTRKSLSTSHSYNNKFVVPGNGHLYESIIENIYKTGPSGVGSTEAVQMNYRSSSALVMHLSSVINGNGKKLMSALPKYYSINDISTYNQSLTPRESTELIHWKGSQAKTLADHGFTMEGMTGLSFMWDNDTVGITQASIGPQSSYNFSNVICGNNYGFFYLAELYRDDQAIHTRFGGDSEEAVAANTWIPCGDAVRFDSAISNSLKIEWSMGDTYFQRYDNIHTFPYTEDDDNQIVDIVSFMCETRVNIDGRYDRNRGLEDNENTRPINANRLNEVYGQDPNYFQYRAIDHDRIVQSKYPMTVAWTKTKQLGEVTDSWTNVTLANTIDMDGSKGQVRALRRLFDDVVVFQDTGISRILYNEQWAVQTENGVPLEIANSAKVTGRHYISPTVGCHNKWSIATSPNGIYFMDDAMQDIMFLNSERQLRSVAANHGFQSWARKKGDIAHTWDPLAWRCMRTLYDKKNSELLFVTADEALSFNEQLDAFTSFYDYQKTPFLEDVQRHHVLMKNQGGFGLLEDMEPRVNIYEHNAGQYNDFFGTYKPFWTELLCHSDGTDKDSPLLDKTWTNVGFQFDTFDDSYTDPKERYKEWEHWDVVDCETEYQKGSTGWNGRYPGIGKKFRMWHADLPRDGYSVGAEGYFADRLRNPWLRMRLTKNTNISRNWRSVLHSVTIGYLE